MLDLDYVKLHLRADGDDEDALIALYSDAAEATAIHHMNRAVYTDQAALDAAIADETVGSNPIVLTSNMRVAMLLIVGHLYANREDVGAGAMAELPMGSRYLLEQHRVTPGL
jgi:uncharacterized phage protein (predicted DNA packaging)